MTSTPPPTRKDRLAELVRLHYEDNNAEFARFMGWKSGGAYVRQLRAGERPITEKTISKIQQRGGGKHREWFAGWTQPQHWASDQHSVAGSLAEPLAQYVSQPEPMINPPTIQWELILSSHSLPPRFKLAVPDDALAPDTPRGTVFIFSTELRPQVGDGVLVEDGTGRRYLRMYAEAPGGGWQAKARQAAYITLDSVADKLVVLATAEYRSGGKV